MKILHSGTFDVSAGGPAMSTYYTLHGLCQLGINAQLISFPLSANGTLIGESVPVHFANKPVDTKILYSPTYKDSVRNLGSFDIYHAQGVWQYPTYAIVDVARQYRTPYLITPRGMLYPQDIAKSSKWFKKLSLKWRLLDDLNRASCVHVTCLEEMEHCRNLGVKSPIAVIPNPIPFRSYPKNKPDSKFRLGYLGRLSPRKNVEGLIYAWAELGNKVEEAELLIIGSDDKKYEDFLKKEVERLSLNNVFFTGFLSGEAKDTALSSLSLLAMPSEFENFGNVILEGLIRNIPCIATKGSPWEQLEEYKCGWWIDYTQDALVSAIGNAVQLSPDELELMGKRGNSLLLKEYTEHAVANKMKALYYWVISGEDKPDFVYL